MSDQDGKSPLKLEFEERKRISFHISGVRGLPHSGWHPIPSTFVHLESLETRQSFSTESKKSGSSITWGENIPIMNLKDSSQVRFEVRNNLLWNKSVVGKTEPISVGDLIKMQREVGDERDAFIDLIVTPTTSLVSTPKSPSLPRHTRSLSSPIQTGFKAPLSPRMRASFIKSPTLPSLDVITLSLSIRETAAKDRNSTLTAADIQRFAEKCQKEALVELQECVQKLIGLRNAFQADGSSLVSLLDMVLGVAQGVRKTLGNPSIRNINKNTVACVKALNGALSPYQNISARQLEKLGDNATTLMREMLSGAVRALESVDVFLGMNNAFTRDKYEFKVTGWLRYFEDCELYLLGTNSSKPDAIINKKSRRVRCHPDIVPNPILPKHNTLEISLPKIHSDNTGYNSAAAQLVSEWIFTSAFRSALPVNDAGLTLSRDSNIMYLSGEAGSGKAQLAAHLSEWLNEIGCLGGYFTFDHPRADLTPSTILDALPLTLVHTAATVEPDMAPHLAAALNPDAATHALESRFQTLFVTPLVAFVASRLPAGGAWNPLQPLVFIIDGIGAPCAGIADAFAEWMTGKGVRALPPHVKFLLLGRPEGGLQAALELRGANCVYVDMDAETHVPQRDPVDIPGSQGADAEHSPSPVSSPKFQVMIQSF